MLTLFLFDKIEEEMLVVWANVELKYLFYLLPLFFNVTSFCLGIVSFYDDLTDVICVERSFESCINGI